MKTSASLVTAALAAAFLALALPSARALNYWDPDHEGPGNGGFGSGGDGTWDLTTANWYDGDADQDIVYPNGNSSIFAGEGGTVTLNASGITTPAIFFRNSGYTLQDAAGTSYGLTAGGVTASATGLISGTNTVNVPLTFTGGSVLQTKAGTTLILGGMLTATSVVTVGASANLGTVTLSGNNGSLSSGLNVAFGTLVAAGNTALGTGSLTLAANTTLMIDSGVRISNEAASTLTLSSATTSFVDLLGSGVQDTVRSLVVNGVTEPAGTYGAQGSGATYTLADFEGTGELQVVPEPGTWAGGALLLAAALTLRQRRRCSAVLPG